MSMIAERDFTYAADADGKLRRLIIRAVEKATGQPKLHRMYLDYLETAHDRDFWEEAVRRLELEVRYDEARLAAVPRQGPVVFVANHPFGVLDGIVICHLVRKVRPDFKVLINSVLFRAPEIRRYMLPIDFAETREALETNLQSRARALEHLRQGGSLVVFPGGTVSTSEKPFGRAFDPEWKPFTAKLIQNSDATVVPVYFPGQNSRAFQIVSQFSMTLRLSLLFKEVVNKIGSEIPVTIGIPVAAQELAGFGDRKALIDHLRAATYALEAKEARAA